jgi:hypothetical protein
MMVPALDTGLADTGANSDLANVPPWCKVSIVGILLFCLPLVTLLICRGVVVVFQYGVMALVQFICGFYTFQRKIKFPNNLSILPGLKAPELKLTNISIQIWTP